MATRTRRGTRPASAPRRAGTVQEAPTRAQIRHVLAPGERVYILSVPYAERSIATGHGARWDPALRATVFIGRSLPSGLQPYAAADYSWERWLEDDANGHLLAPEPGRDPKTPRPHQVEAADVIARAAALGYRGFLEADDVGCGKTLAAVEAVKRVARVRAISNVLVLCPLAVVPHWRRSIADAGDGGLRWCVINYDRAKHLLDVPETAKTAKRLSTRNRRIARDGTSKVRWDFVIADEAHRLRNPDSQRTMAVTTVARYSEPGRTAPFTLWMSATAGQDPTELSYLAPLLTQVTGARRSDLRDFGQWLADQGFHVSHDARYRKWVWTDQPRQRDWDTNRIQGLLFADPDPVAIRRRPTDIAGWPEIVRSLAPVDLDPGQRVLYEQAWTEFRHALKMAARGHDPRGAASARLRFRQKASLLRVDGTVEYVTDLLDNGHQVAVSAWFRESIDALTDRLARRGVPVSIIDGRPDRRNEDERLAFQSGATRVVLFSVTEGISLHQQEALPGGRTATSAPRTLLMHDPRWSAIDCIQVEGRAHRDGKFSQAHYLFGTGTVEEEIVRLVLARMTSTKAMVGDDVSTVRDLESLLDTMAH